MQIYFCLKKNSNLHLRKMQIPFLIKKKFSSTSNKDADLFLFQEKELFTCRSLTFKKEIITITLKEINHALNKTMTNHSCYG